MRKTAILVCVAIGLATSGMLCVAVADSGSAVVAPDSSSNSPNSGSAAAAPADSLHDPLSAPAAAFDDLKAAKKVGWPLAILAGAVIVSRLLGRAGGIFKPLASGKAALVVGAVGAASCSAYNALALGGSWLAVAMALVVAAAAYWDSHAKPKAEPVPSGN